jgi:transposase InsO family protein
MDAIKGIVNKVARREKIPRHGVSTGLPTQSPHRHHLWTWDFIFDRTDNGGSLKMMTLLDEYSRQSLAIQVERQITAAQALGVLEQAMIQYGVPGYIRSDSGREFIATKVQRCCATTRSRRYISIRVARGQMDTSKVFTAVSVTNV